jgi:putative redox protein
MSKMYIEYLGDLHCKAIHGPSGSELLTDAPPDNNGKGEYFSPTDLLATAAGTCVLTIMGMVAQKHNIDITGLKINVIKEMVSDPLRRVGMISLDFIFPRKLPDKEFQIMKNCINTCPVIRSLHPDLEIETHISFAEE